MKKPCFFVIALALSLNIPLSALGQGQVTFSPQSALPTELKSLVEDAISKRCSSSIYDIQETQTRVREESVDQGKRDKFFSSEFSAVENFGGIHPAGVQVYVESAEFDIDNPSVERVQILSLSSSPKGTCH